MLEPGKSGTLGSALTIGSANYEVQLTDHHLRLLRMRTSADLEGIELGPELGRGSFGRVYKGAPPPVPYPAARTFSQNEAVHQEESSCADPVNRSGPALH